MGTDGSTTLLVGGMALLAYDWINTPLCSWLGAEPFSPTGVGLVFFAVAAAVFGMKRALNV